MVSPCTCTGKRHAADCAWIHALAGIPVPLEPALVTLPPDASEEEFQAAQRRLALAAGYLYYHTRDSRKSDKGFPDTAIIHRTGGTLYLWENKNAHGRPTKEQEAWLYALQHCTGVDAALMKPWNWREILAKLTQRRP